MSLYGAVRTTQPHETRLRSMRQLPQDRVPCGRSPRQRKERGARRRPNLPTYLPTYLPTCLPTDLATLPPTKRPGSKVWAQGLATGIFPMTPLAAMFPFGETMTRPRASSLEDASRNLESSGLGLGFWGQLIPGHLPVKLHTAAFLF